MFIHWGLYSQTGCRWQGQDGKSAMMYYLKIPLAQYTTLARQFNPVQFNADQWAGLAKEAGMNNLVRDWRGSSSPPPPPAPTQLVAVELDGIVFLASVVYWASGIFR